MIDCVCSFVNSALQNEIFQSVSVQALEHAKTLTNCNIRECFEELYIPYSSKTDYPIEFLLLPVVIGLLFVRPKLSHK